MIQSRPTARRKSTDATTAAAPQVASAPVGPAPAPAQTGTPLKCGAVCVGDVVDPKLTKTLCGEYTESGSNQGRRVFFKVTQSPDGVPVKVFLYYWDDRDGPDFQGWWIGNKVGGSNVWAHCQDDSELPPERGWQVPHDGPICEGFSLLDYDAYVQHRRNQAVREKQEEAKRKKIEVLKARREVKIQDRKFEEAEKVQALIDEASQRVDLAEDLVEKSQVAVDEVNQAFRDQEEIPAELLDRADGEVKNATTVLCQALVTTNAKLTGLQRDVDTAKEAGRPNGAAEKGVLDMTKLHERITQAQSKLKPLKTVREDSQQKVKRAKLRRALETMLSEMEMKLDSFHIKELDSQDKDVAKEAKAQLDASREMVLEGKELFGKRYEVETLLPDELAELDERVQKALRKVAEADLFLKQGLQKRAVEGYVIAANEKMQEVTDAFLKVELAANGLLHEDTLDLKTTLAAAKSSEEAAITAEANIATVKKFVATKMLEIRRMPADVVASPTASLQDIEKELDNVAKKLSELRSGIGNAKRNANILQVKHAIEHAETMAEAVAETAHVVADDALLLSLSANEIKAAGVAIAKAEKEANSALVEAQKALTARQMDTRGSNASAEARAELAALQTRIGAAGVKVAKQKKLVDTAEERKSRVGIFKEAEGKLQAAENLVAKAVLAAAEVGANAAPQVEDEAKKADRDEDAQTTEQVALLKISEETTAAAHASIKEVDNFLGSQMTALGSAALEVAKLSSRVKDALLRLCTSEKSLKTRSENIVVSSMILECKSRAREAADALQKADEAKAVCAGGLDRLPCHAVVKAVGTLETTTQEASTLVGNAKTFLAMKRIAVKKMSAAAFRNTTEAFTTLQTQMDSSGKRLHELRSSIPRLKKEAINLEAGGFVATARKLTDGAKQLTDQLSLATDTISTEEMKIETAKVDVAQEDARKAIAGFLKLMEKRRKSLEQKQDGEESEANQEAETVGEEFLEAQKELEKVQAELEKQRVSLTKSEHRFVSRMLVVEARTSVDALESKLEGISDLSAKLFAAPWKDFAASLALVELTRAWKAHLETRSETPLKLFQTLIGQADSDDGVVTELHFTKFMKSISEEQIGIPEYPEDQLSAIFAELVETCGGTIVEDSFLKLFDCRYRCMATVTMTDGLEIKAAKTIRKLEVDEVVVAQGEVHQDEKIGLQRVLAVADKDSAKGWISVSGNQGKVFLQQLTPYDDCLRQVERAIKTLQEDISSTSKFLSEKASSLKPVRTGPLTEAKAEIAKMQTQASQAEKKVKALKDKVIESKQKHSKHMAREQARHKEAADRRCAAEVVSESTSLIKNIDTETSQVFAEAEALLENGEKKEEAFVGMQKKLAACLQSIAKAADTFQAKLASLKSASTGPLAKAKGDMVKLKVSLGTIEVKCKRLHEEVSSSLV